MTARAVRLRSPARSILIGSGFMLSTLLTTWRGRMRSKVSDMQMPFFWGGWGGVLSLHIPLLWQGAELSRAAQHTHVTTDGSLKHFLMAAMYRPICSRSRARRRRLLYLFRHQAPLIYSCLAETFNHFQLEYRSFFLGFSRRRLRIGR